MVADTEACSKAHEYNKSSQEKILKSLGSSPVCPVVLTHAVIVLRRYAAKQFQNQWVLNQHLNGGWESLLWMSSGMLFKRVGPVTEKVPCHWESAVPMCGHHYLELWLTQNYLSGPVEFQVNKTYNVLCFHVKTSTESSGGSSNFKEYLSQFSPLWCKLHTWWAGRQEEVYQPYLVLHFVVNHSFKVHWGEAGQWRFDCVLHRKWHWPLSMLKTGNHAVKMNKRMNTTLPPTWIKLTISE